MTFRQVPHLISFTIYRNNAYLTVLIDVNFRFGLTSVAQFTRLDIYFLIYWDNAYLTVLIDVNFRFGLTFVAQFTRLDIYFLMGKMRIFDLTIRVTQV